MTALNYIIMYTWWNIDLRHVLFVLHSRAHSIYYTYTVCVSLGRKRTQNQSFKKSTTKSVGVMKFKFALKMYKLINFSRRRVTKNQSTLPKHCNYIIFMYIRQEISIKLLFCALVHSSTLEYGAIVRDFHAAGHYSRKL
jgi:hypothetical protein